MALDFDDRWSSNTPVHGPTVDNRRWHPNINLDMVQDFDISVANADDILHLIVVPDGWTSLNRDRTGFAPGPPVGVHLTGRKEEEEGE